MVIGYIIMPNRNAKILASILEVEVLDIEYQRFQSLCPIAFVYFAVDFTDIEALFAPK